jgi:predicted DNA-binding protein with PD1-like motif
MNYKTLSSGFLLRFNSGENVLENFSEFLEKEKVSSGIFYAIGALEKAEIGYFLSEEKKYSSKVFEENLEVLSFTGNITLKEGKPFVHAHAVLGRKDFSVIGGHFVSGIVGATLELFVKQIQPAIERKEAENGLFLLDL